MIDGTVARKTGKVSDFGAKLDSIADIVFVVVCLIKLLPVINIPVWLYVWLGIIALIRIINIVSGYIMQKRISMLHTIMNRVTGFLLFILPMTLIFTEIKYTAIPVCAVETFAAIQEGHLIRTVKYDQIHHTSARNKYQRKKQNLNARAESCFDTDALFRSFYLSQQWQHHFFG